MRKKRLRVGDQVVVWCGPYDTVTGTLDATPRRGWWMIRVDRRFVWAAGSFITVHANKIRTV